MIRTCRIPIVASAIAAAAMMLSLAPGWQPQANADPVYRGPDGRYYYDGGYAPARRGYSGYGYRPYGYGGYTYSAPRAYFVPPYRSYGFSYGQGPGGRYNGFVDHDFGSGGLYVQPYRQTYNPYGYGGYIQFGF